TVASESTNQKPRSKIRKQYKEISKTCKWWYSKITPPGYKWKPKTSIVNVKPNIIEIILFIVDSGCSTHMPENLKLLRNITIKRVYYVEGLNHNLFSVGQLCDADLKVAFWKSTCYIRDLKGNDLLIGSRGTYLYSITLQDTSTPNPICLMAKASSSQACWEKQNAEAIATACLTQKCSLVVPRHEKTPYQIINGRKPSVKFFHIFGSLCYIVKDGENLDKIKEKGDACIFVGYSTQLRAYRVYNKRTRVIVKTIHVNFDELPQMASDHISSDPVPQCLTKAFEQDSLSPGPQSQENVPQAAKTVTTLNELDLLFSPMFDELLNGTTLVVSKSSALTAADAPDQHQQHNTTSSTSIIVVADTPPLNIQTTHGSTSQAPSQAPTQAPTITSTNYINQAETQKENAQVEEDKFINIFSTPVQERGETSS
ncbi:integrase, catalytic region, zinc finger, CCHC-type containing protein, partial [Tanacetum coccineum]